MKVLWIVNTIFPDPARQLGYEKPIHGGWMFGLASDIVNSRKINLAIATVYTGKKLKIFDISGVKYYLIPKKKLIQDNHSLSWKIIIENFNPDVVHIHGTEYNYGFDLMNEYPKLKYIISLQGIVSIIHRFYLAGMSFSDVFFNITFRDIVKWNTIYHQKNNFLKQGKIEREYICRANSVIGRTEWDKVHALTINPKQTYYKCNESLRDEFYHSETWELEKCRKYSIFLSQAGYPIKGLHQVIKAVEILKSEYPDILIQVAGHDITKSERLVDKLKRTGYGSYIKKLIKKSCLEKNIKFLGPLNANEIKSAYLKSHIFICPSSIENSPNSLGEAQILGVPCIAAYTGGIPSMTKDGESVIMYQFEEYEMMANYIREIFSSPHLSTKLSESSVIEAKSRHNRENNLNEMIKIYSN